VAAGQQVADDQPTDLSGRAEDGDVYVSAFVEEVAS
jgi:hypothetical protein